MDQEQRIKIKNYEALNQTAKKHGILFTGSSLMEQFPICELCVNHGMDQTVYNRGVGGFTTEDFWTNRNIQLFDLEPRKVFINIGTNDMHPRFGADWEKRLLQNYRRILVECKEQLRKTEVILMAYYPVNDQISFLPDWAKEACQVRTLENLNHVNGQVKALAEELGYTYLDANVNLTDEHGRLKEAYTIDGIHMYAPAYEQVFDAIRPWIV